MGCTGFVVRVGGCEVVLRTIKWPSKRNSPFKTFNSSVGSCKDQNERKNSNLKRLPTTSSRPCSKLALTCAYAYYHRYVDDCICMPLKTLEKSSSLEPQPRDQQPHPSSVVPSLNQQALFPLHHVVLNKAQTLR